MPNPILAALSGMDRPPQFIRIEKTIPLDIGMEGRAFIDFVVHEKDEMGTTLRITDIKPAGSMDTIESGSPRTGTTRVIIPSPSA